MSRCGGGVLLHEFGALHLPCLAFQRCLYIYIYVDCGMYETDPQLGRVYSILDLDCVHEARIIVIIHWHRSFAMQHVTRMYIRASRLLASIPALHASGSNRLLSTHTG